MFSFSCLPQKLTFLSLRNIYKGIKFKNRFYVTSTFFPTMSLQQRIIYDLSSETSYFNNIINVRYMAGHAKWQNIKHVKAEKDRQKGLRCNKMVFLISLAVKEGGSDPKINNRLSLLMEQAKKYNIPLSTIENSLKKSSNRKTKFGSIEILGPGGCILIIEYESDNVSTTRHEIKSILKKYNANIMPGEGRWRAVYEQKGIIKVVNLKDGQPLDAEKALDSAIEAGAEEVLTKQDEEDKTYFEFLCAPNDINQVKKEIERQYVVEEGYVAYIPTVTIELNKEDSSLMDNLLEDLGNMPDIFRIYENAQ